jgi:uncharacterized membrane protein
VTAAFWWLGLVLGLVGAVRQDTFALVTACFVLLLHVSSAVSGSDSAPAAGSDDEPS